jgi:phenylacetate-CoA ligase
MAADLFARRVEDAMRRFPAYAAKAASRGGVPARPETLPVWTREDQRALFDSLAGPPARSAFVNATGGSTGMPIRYYVTRESWEWRLAVSDRGYGWAGAGEGTPSFYVWGTAVFAPGRFTRAWQRAHHVVQRRVFFDSFDFGEQRMALCCDAINRFGPAALVGYAGNLMELADYVRRHPGALKRRARTAVAAAEALPPGGRELVEAHLADEVFLSYGSREFMLIGMECRQHAGYHLASDNLLVEVAGDDGRPLPPGEPGRILVTDLRNDANPFVRYDIGDVGVMGDPRRRCPCGLPFPLLLSVEGRSREIILTPSGKKLTALFIPHMMKEFAWARGYQVVQDDPAGVTMTLVCDGELTPALTDRIAECLRPRLESGMRLEFRRVERLRKTRTGKTPIVVSGADPSLRSG